MGRCRNTAGLQGKTLIITGCNTGIGKETARDLIQRGARVIFACRDLAKAQAAKEEIVAEIGHERNIVIRHLDLSSLASVRKFAEDIIETEERLDILINNAGVAWIPRQVTADGFEKNFGVNHLGHFLLTNLLLDLLKASAPSRVINVSSLAHKYGTINFEDLMLKNNYTSWKAYAQSKLANVLFTKELAKRLKDTGVTTYALHPGSVYTDIIRSIRFLHWPVIGTCILFLSKMFLKTPRQGAQTTIYCAVEEDLVNQSGYYYSDCAEERPSAEAQNVEVASRLWDTSAELVGLYQHDKE